MCYLFCCSTMHATLTLCHFCLFYSSICRSSAPLCPSHVEALKQHDTSLGVLVLVQPSGRRIFSDAEYEHPGAMACLLSSLFVTYSVVGRSCKFLKWGSQKQLAN
jgi:hypothetical protein